jgi:2-oxo-4-hydroxy-4-carboxy-5-ureidoimidazoline decarboxylase
MNLDAINAWDEALARVALRKCCGSLRWAESMAARRPFRSAADLFAAAEEAADGLTRADWLEAFAAHPRIGDRESLRTRFAGTASWSAAEQAGVTGAPEAVLEDLARGNAAYEAKFGHIFIVCATGKGAPEMLALLRRRLANDPDEELRIAAAQQRKITRLRLEKLGS